MRTRRARKRRRDALGYALLALGLVALATMAAAGILLRPPPIDAQTLCRRDQPVAAHTYILVDATDSLEPRHRRRVRAVLDQERARLNPYERLTIARIRADRPSDPDILASLCAPRSGDVANPLIENPKRLQERWDSDFGAALDRALRRATSRRNAPASPIAAGVRAAAADMDFTASIAQRRFVLISDLLENNPQGFSLYADDADFAAFLQSANGAAGAPDLAGVDVRIVMLDRDDQIARQRRARDVFWTPYFDAADARTVEFDPTP
ncbi:MAG: hypothetical protein GC189_14140 [Alphaproteobacteria bacterium]|nr:hypothetical protein [Alphaproteobacteria bacterium]